MGRILTQNLIIQTGLIGIKLKLICKGYKSGDSLCVIYTCEVTPILFWNYRIKLYFEQNINLNIENCFLKKIYKNELKYSTKYINYYRLTISSGHTKYAKYSNTITI